MKFFKWGYRSKDNAFVAVLDSPPVAPTICFVQLCDEEQKFSFSEPCCEADVTEPDVVVPLAELPKPGKWLRARICKNPYFPPKSIIDSCSVKIIGDASLLAELREFVSRYPDHHGGDDVEEFAQAILEIMDEHGRPTD